MRRGATVAAAKVSRASLSRVSCLGRASCAATQVPSLQEGLVSPRRRALGLDRCANGAPSGCSPHQTVDTARVGVVHLEDDAAARLGIRPDGESAVDRLGVRRRDLAGRSRDCGQGRFGSDPRVATSRCRTGWSPVFHRRSVFVLRGQPEHAPLRTSAFRFWFRSMIGLACTCDPTKLRNSVKRLAALQSPGRRRVSECCSR